MKTFPMFIRTTGRRVVLVGGAEQAAQKMRLLLKTDADLIVVAPQLEDELQQVVNDVLKANPDVVEKIKNGKTGSANFLMGQVMKETKGRAKPDTVRDLIISACQSE